MADYIDAPEDIAVPSDPKALAIRAQRRILMLLLVLFAASATALAAVGIYG